MTAGKICTVNVTFALLSEGIRNVSVEIIDGSGNVLTTTEIYGFGQIPPSIDFTSGFGQAKGEMQFNGSASLSGTSLELTNGRNNEASSAFYPTPVNIQSFTTHFTFQLTDANADGFTFTIECRSRRPGSTAGASGMRASARVLRSSSIFTKVRGSFQRLDRHFCRSAFPIGPW